MVPLVPPTLVRLPPRIGGHVVEERIGSGGVSVVLQVRSFASGHRQAMKVLVPPAAARAIDRLHAEAAVLEVVDHPHVPYFVELGFDGELGFHYLVMELVPGGSVSRSVPPGSGAVLLEQVASWGVQVCSALAAVHALGVVHRDVKPSNLLLTLDGRVKLTDFGVSHVPQRPVPTAHDAILGTIGFMAPEQATDPDHPVPSSDLYGLGASLFHLVGPERTRPLWELGVRDPAWSSVPDRLRPVLYRATRADPADRFADARSMALALAPMVPERAWAALPHLGQWLGRATSPRGGTSG